LFPTKSGKLGPVFHKSALYVLKSNFLGRKMQQFPQGKKTLPIITSRVKKEALTCGGLISGAFVS
jgi:hypothetical protein